MRRTARGRRVDSRAMKRFVGVLLILVALPLLSLGGYGLWLVNATSQPAVLTLDEYVATNSAARWVRLTDCKLNLLESFETVDESGQPAEIYVPIHSANHPNPVDVHILLRLKDEKVRQMLKTIRDLPDETALFNYIIFQRDSVFPRRDIEGAIRFSGEFTSDQRTMFRKGSKELVPNYRVMLEGEKPSSQNAFQFLIAGTVVLVLGLLIFIWGRQKKAA
jgi:hypothetical protein